MNQNNLPLGFELLKSEKSYWKPSEMQEGDHRLRILGRPIAGWIDWEGSKPCRYRPDQKPEASFDPERPIRPFWNCYVWDYTRAKLCILEITQNSILKTLSALGEDPEWGDITSYDIKIKKSGSGKETKYQVTPLPPKPMDEKIVQELSARPVDLEALYEGKDPWEKAIHNEIWENMSEASAAPDIISQDQLQDLEKMIGDDSGYRSNLLKFLKRHLGVSSLAEIPRDWFDRIYSKAKANHEASEALNAELAVMEA